MSKRKRIKKWTPVCVVWDDAVTVYDQASSKESFPTQTRKTIGWLITKNRLGITVAMEDDRADDGENDCQTITTIPMRMVSQVIELQVKPEVA